MKLVFPGGEHPQVLLGHGVNRIGSDPQSTIVIDRPGVMPQHCQLHVTTQGVMLDVPSGTAVTVNGRSVAGLIALRPGDSVGFDRVMAKLAALGPAPAMQRPLPGTELDSANDDPGVTAVRPVIPRFMLRGVSADASGRNEPLFGVLTVGRGSECAMRFDAPGLSRIHARLMPTDEGVQIEDLGSSNGTFLNGERVLRAQARVGDEIGFDTLRFRLVAAAQREPVQVVARSMRASPKQVSGGAPWGWIALVAVLAAVAAAVVLI